MAVMPQALPRAARTARAGSSWTLYAGLPVPSWPPDSFVPDRADSFPSARLCKQPRLRVVPSSSSPSSSRGRTWLSSIQLCGFLRVSSCSALGAGFGGSQMVRSWLYLAQTSLGSQQGAAGSGQARPACCTRSKGPRPAREGQASLFLGRIPAPSPCCSLGELCFPPIPVFAAQLACIKTPWEFDLLLLGEETSAELLGSMPWRSRGLWPLLVPQR